MALLGRAFSNHHKLTYMHSRFIRLIAGATVALSLFGAVGVAQASSLTSAQVSAILGLLASFGASQDVINNVNTALGGTNSGSMLSCSSFADVSYGNFDNNPGGRVSQLQTWLGIPSNTFGFGTYGRKTQAVWNSQCGGNVSTLVSTSASTGVYKGYETYHGSAQEALFSEAPNVTQANALVSCKSHLSNYSGSTIRCTWNGVEIFNNTYVTPTTYTPPSTVVNAKSSLLPDTLKIVSPSSDTAVAVGQKITISYSVGGNIVANDPAIVERKIVKSATDTSVAGYIPVSVSGGAYTFDWTPSEAGTYQVLLSISYNNTTYPARSAVITVGSGNTTSTNTSNAPGVTFSSISSGNVIGSFANLPANSQIRFVNASTGQRYDAQSTMVWSGGSGPLSITIPNDLPNSTYYLRATDYYNPNTTIAQSSSFLAGTTIAAPSATLDQSSLTSTSATPTLTGTETGAVGLYLAVSDASSGNNAFSVTNVSVVNGKWTVTFPNSLANGSYKVTVVGPGYVPLANGTLTVSH